MAGGWSSLHLMCSRQFRVVSRTAVSCAPRSSAPRRQRGITSQVRIVYVSNVRDVTSLRRRRRRASRHFEYATSRVVASIPGSAVSVFGPPRRCRHRTSDGSTDVCFKASHAVHVDLAKISTDLPFSFLSKKKKGRKKNDADCYYSGFDDVWASAGRNETENIWWCALAICEPVESPRAEGTGGRSARSRARAARTGSVPRKRARGMEYPLGVAHYAAPRFASRAKMAADFGQDPDGRCAAPRRVEPNRAEEINSALC